MKKKSQLTIFIIVGILILLMIVLGMVVLLNMSEEDDDIIINPENDGVLVSTYIESCLGDVLSDSAIEIAAKGGSLNPNSGIYDVLDEGQVNVLSQYFSGEGYVNVLLTKEDLEKQLSSMIDKRIYGCIDRQKFTDMGLEVRLDDASSHVIIRDEEIEVLLSMPVEIVRGESIKKREKFSSIAAMPLGNLHKIALDILNAEATQGFFDKEAYILEHGSDVIIDKKRPYPDTVYRITKKIIGNGGEAAFNFAIKGVDTAGRETIVFKEGGCCIENDACHKNIAKDECVAAGYGYEDAGCRCDDNYRIVAEGCCKIADGCFVSSGRVCSGFGGAFKQGDIRCLSSGCTDMKCTATYNYADDALSGLSRQHGESWCVYESMAGKGLDYVGSRHYLHSCINGVEHVEGCRDYREELCAEELISEEGEEYIRANCRLNRWYDCSEQMTKDDCEENTKRDCFWSYFIWTDKKCHPYVSPGFKFWTPEAERICRASSFQKDDFGWKYPRSWGYSTLIYCQRSGDCGGYRNVADDLTKTGYFNMDGSPEDWAFFPDGYADKGERYTIPLDLYNTETLPDASMPDPGSMAFGAYAVCDSWDAPNTNRCSLCGNIMHDCTEYRCRSLGKNCEFRKADKACIMSGQGDMEAPVIEIEELSEGFTFSKSSSPYYIGKTLLNIFPEVSLHQPLSLRFTTDEPTRCRLSIMPPGISKDIIPAGLNIPEIMLNDYEYKSEYDIGLRLPSSELTSMKSYLIFMVCNDEDGNMNDDVILSLSLFEPVNDFGAPEIIEVSTDADIDKGILDTTFFVNEPFKDCRYSFAPSVYEMMTSFGCSAEIRDILYYPYHPLGSFMCSKSIDIAVEDYKNIFIICEDKPGNKNTAYQHVIIP